MAGFGPDQGLAHSRTIAEAKQLAEQYEQDFPNGRRLDDIQRQLSEAVQAKAAEADEIEPSEEEPEVEEPSGADAGAGETQL